MDNREAKAPETGPSTVTKHHWPLYFDEASELAIFMLSACAFTVFLFDPAYHMSQYVPSAVLRRLLMGVAMGVTAILIINSPMGGRSGAHFNPAITLTYLRLGKIARWDAALYITFQFFGGVFGVLVAVLIFGHSLAAPTVEYAITVPGPLGTTAAFAAEFVMAALLMGVVLWTSNRPRLAAYTSYSVGCLIALYIVLFAPISGFSINPARTVGSAVFAGIWHAIWIYFTAPLFGMLSAAELYVRIQGADRVLCAKLRPSADASCPFLCYYPGHRHPSQHIGLGENETVSVNETA